MGVRRHRPGPPPPMGTRGRAGPAEPAPSRCRPQAAPSRPPAAAGRVHFRPRRRRVTTSGARASKGRAPPPPALLRKRPRAGRAGGARRGCCSCCRAGDCSVSRLGQSPGLRETAGSAPACAPGPVLVTCPGSGTLGPLIDFVLPP